MSQAEIVGSKPAYIISTTEITREVPDWLKFAFKNAEAIERVRQVLAEVPETRKTLGVRALIANIEQALDGEQE